MTRYVDSEVGCLEITIPEGILDISGLIEEYIKCFLPEGKYKVILTAPPEIKGSNIIISGKEPRELEIYLKYTRVNEVYTDVYEKAGEEESLKFKVEVSGKAGVSKFGAGNIYKIRKLE